MTVDLARVANDFILKANEENLYLPPTKLLKLVYFMFGHYIRETGDALFDENFKVWEHGPVVPELYNKIKKKPDVSELIQVNDKYYITNPNNEAGQRYFRIFKYVWDKYRLLSATTLSLLTHAKGSPWAVTKDKSGLYSVIENDIIEKYFNGVKLGDEH